MTESRGILLAQLSIDGTEERCRFWAILMALRDKVRQTFGHRWMPFFLPIVASLVYALLAELLVPSRLGGSPTADADAKEELSGAPLGSSTGPEGAAARALRRRPRIGARSPAGTPPGAAPPVAAPPQPVVAPAAPASPDGND